MLCGAALVGIRRRQWKTLGALAGIGAVSGASLVIIYLPIIRWSSVYMPMVQDPTFKCSIPWHKLGQALTARSSAQAVGPNGPEIWLWIMLLLGGSIVAFMMQRARERQAQNQEAVAAIAARTRTDLALFCVVSMLFGTAGYMAFLLQLKFLTSNWYYVEMLCLCAISLDGILSANWPRLHPWGLLRIGLLVVMMTWSARSAWEEAHTRRSNVDLIAAVLGQKATEGDLIVVQDAWDGITFDRYYHGRAHWVTVPPIDSHKVHRTDLVMEKMNQRDPMAPVLREIIDTLRGSNSVWMVGNMTDMRLKQSPPSCLPLKWWGWHINCWGARVTAYLQDYALQKQALEISVDEPVNRLENLPLVRFSGYKPDTD
jgi:hypothetical protein